MNKIDFVFFGSAPVSTYVLDELKAAGYIPSLIVTYPPKPVGRNLTLTANPVAKWAKENSIATIEEPKLIPAVVEKIKEKSAGISLFIVAGYGQLIPKAILDIPKHGTLNVHPSLLPKYRGPAPILTPFLNNDAENGITVMLIDEQMDHGPIVAQEKTEKAKVNSSSDLSRLYPEFEELMFRKGGRLLAKVIPNWVTGKIKATEQDHAQATYTKKITKEDGLGQWEELIKATTSGSAVLARQLALKFSAYSKWPSLYTFYEDQTGKKIRLKITAAIYSEEAGTFTPTKVIPEGKGETDAKRFLQPN